MNKRVCTGILAGVLSATVILGVAGTAYRIGQSHDVVTRPVGGDGTGEVVRVVGGYRGWGHGHSGGFFLFPLLPILLVFLLVRAARGGHRGCGPCGPGPDGRFEEQHRQAHERTGVRDT